MPKKLGLRKLLGMAIIMLCVLFLMVQTNLYSAGFPNTSLEADTLSILAGGGIVLGSYLVLGPAGILASLAVLSAGGCVGGGRGEGGRDLGEPPNPPED